LSIARAISSWLLGGKSAHGFHGLVQELGHQRITCASPDGMEGLRSTIGHLLDRWRTESAHVALSLPARGGRE
jgi:hypothetical protein